MYVHHIVAVGIIALSLLSRACSYVTYDGPPVDTIRGSKLLMLPVGFVNGTVVETHVGTQAFAFFGIPYAKAPIGELRFAKPIPQPPWNGVIQCQRYRKACPQNRTASAQGPTSEDCLFLNIFTGPQCQRHPDGNGNCSVIFYIHGGGLEFDNPKDFPPELLIDNFVSRNVVFVTIAYRLGALGFWNTGSADAPGNWAFQDLLLGLKWTRDYISYFGGQPDEVSIMGHSGGAVASSLLTLSPLSAGLFRSAIVMSGTALMPAERINSAQERHRFLAQELGCASASSWAAKNFQSILACMRKVPVDQLIEAYVHPTDDALRRYFGPDKRQWPKEGLTSPSYDGPGGVFPDNIDVLKHTRRPLPFLIGTVTREFPLEGYADLTNPTGSATPESAVRRLCTDVVASGQATGQYKQQKSIVDLCTSHYVDLAKTLSGHSNISQSILSQVLETIPNDASMFAPTFEDAASMRDQGGDVFLYQFDYTPAEGIPAYHAFDMTYVIGIHLRNFSEEDEKIRKIYVDLLANFSKFSDPTPNQTWRWFPLMKPTGFNYNSIRLPHPENLPFYHFDAVTFWNTVVQSVENILEASTDSETTNENEWKTGFLVTIGVLVSSAVLVLIGYFGRKLVRTRRGAPYRRPSHISEVAPPGTSPKTYKTFDA